MRVLTISLHPLLLILGIDDAMVRFAEAGSLFERSGEPKKQFTIPDINRADVYGARNAEALRTAAWFNA